MRQMRSWLLTFFLAAMMILAVPAGVLAQKPAFLSQGAVSEEESEGEQIPEPEPKNGLVKEEQGYRFYENDVPVKTAWKDVEGKRYYFGKDGYAVTDSVKIDDTYYVFSARGVLQTGEKARFVTVNKVKYGVSAKGKALVGSAKIGDTYYIFSTKGVLQTGKKARFVTVNKVKYGVSAKGKALTDSAKIDDTYYIFNAKGTLRTGKNSRFVTINKAKYGVSAKGKALTGSVKLSGKYYIFEKTGKLSVAKSSHVVTVGKNKFGAKKNGQALNAGIYVFIEGEENTEVFYRFNKGGKVDTKTTAKLKKAAKYQKNMKDLYKLIGKPKKASYYDGCFDPNGKDGVLKYENFTVYTFKYIRGKNKGKELYMGAE